MASLSGNLATMGPAMPYALAAKFAYPDRPVFALAGDGAVQMNGMNELITVSKYWKEWSDPRFFLLVLNNRDLNMVTWEMRAQSGEPKFEGSQEIPDFNYALYAESLMDLRPWNLWTHDGAKQPGTDDLITALELALRADPERSLSYDCRPDTAMISCSVATWRAKAPRPVAVAVTVVWGFLPTKAFSTAT